MSISSDFLGECDSYCKHGGVCRLKAGHSGKHNTNFCTWDDEESITKEEADALLEGKASPFMVDLLRRFT